MRQFENLKMWVAVCVLCFALCACVTKQKAVEQTKAEVEAGASSGNKIDANLNLKSNRENEGFGLSEFAQAASWMNWQFNGKPEDKFKLAINKTEKGYEVTAEGTGTANGASSASATEQYWEIKYQEKFDSLSAFYEKKFAENANKIAYLQKEMSKEKEVKGTTAGVYIIAGVLLIVVIFIVWLGWTVKSYLKEARAFMNFKSLLKDG
jgi:hypothetical protein